jgi:type IV/VI secretion system ImpK/VasF family protein
MDKSILKIKSESFILFPFIRFQSINSLVAAAMPLLFLIIKFRKTEINCNIIELREKVLHEVRDFELRAQHNQYSAEIISTSRYCICTAIDEIALLASGSNQVWAQNTLLNHLQKETWGGERFFEFLEEASKKPKENLALLELLYLILSLGFEGKYYNQEKSIREEVRQRLYHLIYAVKNEEKIISTPSVDTLKEEPLLNSNRYSILKMSLFFIIIAVILSMPVYYLSGKILDKFNINQQESSYMLQQQLLKPAEIKAPDIASLNPEKISHPKKLKHHSVYHRWKHHLYPKFKYEMVDRNYWHDYF